MELNKQLIQSIAKTYGISAEDLTAKLTSEEPQELELAGQLFTDAELQSRDSGKYNEGKKVGQERTVKDLKQKYGYELDGVKDIEGFMSHHEEQLKSKYSKNSNERVKELESDLTKQKQAYEQELENLKNSNNDLLGKYKKQASNNVLLSIIPENTSIKKEAIVTLFNTDYELEHENGVTLVKKNGEILKDPKTTDPLKVNDVFNDWLIKENYIAKPNGRGNGNDFGKNGKIIDAKSPEEFQTKWLAQNPDKSLNSKEYENAYFEYRESQKQTA